MVLKSIFTDILLQNKFSQQLSRDEKYIHSFNLKTQLSQGKVDCEDIKSNSEIYIPYFNSTAMDFIFILGSNQLQLINILISIIQQRTFIFLNLSNTVFQYWIRVLLVNLIQENSILYGLFIFDSWFHRLCPQLATSIASRPVVQQLILETVYYGAH